jgi:hypothetical protein
MLRRTVQSTGGHRYRTIEEPQPEDVITAIVALDGKGEIELDHPGVAWLGVAGGPRRYFVGYSRDDDGMIQQARNINTAGN